MDGWQAAQHRDECVRRERALQALKAAEAAGTPREDVIVLAYECGLGRDYEEEVRQ